MKLLYNKIKDNTNQAFLLKNQNALLLKKTIAKIDKKDTFAGLQILYQEDFSLEAEPTGVGNYKYDSWIINRSFYLGQISFATMISIEARVFVSVEYGSRPIIAKSFKRENIEHNISRTWLNVTINALNITVSPFVATLYIYKGATILGTRDISKPMDLIYLLPS